MGNELTPLGVIMILVILGLVAFGVYKLLLLLTGG